MINLSNYWNKEKVSLSKIAKDEDISPKYLERLFSRLKKSGLVVAEKGATGGYALAMDPKDITIFDIVKSLEGKMSPFHCVDESGKIYCGKDCKCGATLVLVKVQKAINDTLKGIKLKDLI